MHSRSAGQLLTTPVPTSHSVAYRSLCCDIRNDCSQGGVVECVLTIVCPDKPGIVYAVSSFLVQHSGNILASQQFDDRPERRFFMRVQFETLDPDVTLDELRHGFSWVAESFHMSWRLVAETSRVRTLIMVSKLGHCLNDLLFRWHSGALPIDVAGIVSNHPDATDFAARYDIPYHHVPVTPETKADAEALLLQLVRDLDIELVVLARYMQILSDDLCKQLEGRAINIHHSFLPSFKGAKPYHQAHERGVKLVGATAHYITPELDEGPVIEQDVIRVDHNLGPEQFVAAGRDVECLVLARAVKWHAEHRVLLNGNRTVVFR
ncbi:MAG: formyltetrahydrofolate deformylase [Micromonosporaceae bacterium]|nr:formyltetrahydrofolate deformylase [Micromonosporaceae bacterium]